MRNIKEVKKFNCLLRLESPSKGLTMDLSITGFPVLCVLKTKNEKENGGIFQHVVHWERNVLFQGPATMSPARRLKPVHTTAKLLL